jgi:hypothetical protein
MSDDTSPPPPLKPLTPLAAPMASNASAEKEMNDFVLWE